VKVENFQGMARGVMAGGGRRGAGGGEGRGLFRPVPGIGVCESLVMAYPCMYPCLCPFPCPCPPGPCLSLSLSPPPHTHTQPPPHLHHVRSHHRLSLVVLLAEHVDDGLGQVDLLLLLEGGPHNGEHQHPQVERNTRVNLGGRGEQGRGGEGGGDVISGVKIGVNALMAFTTLHRLHKLLSKDR